MYAFFPDACIAQCLRFKHWAMHASGKITLYSEHCNFLLNFKNAGKEHCDYRQIGYFQHQSRQFGYFYPQKHQFGDIPLKMAKKSKM